MKTTEEKVSELIYKFEDIKNTILNDVVINLYQNDVNVIYHRYPKTFADVIRMREINKISKQIVKQIHFNAWNY